jgi:putative transposase
MPRIARIVIPGIPHHVTHRGNNGQKIFRHDEDYEIYLNYLRHYAKIFGLRIIGFCLMPNHVHMIVIPQFEYSIAKAVGISHMKFSQHMNKKYNRSGHLWGGRYFSCPVDEKHLVASMRYIELNPVNASIVTKPWAYRWSSAAAHIGRKDIFKLPDIQYWYSIYSPDDWYQFLGESIDPAIIRAIKKHLKTGKPLGSDSFIRMIERETGRRMKRAKRGRPEK